MTDAEAYIALNMVPRIGPVRVRRLLDAMGSPVEILRAPASRLEGVEGIGPEAAKSIRDWESRVDLSGELALVREFGARVLTLADPGYPTLLREIHDPPTVLYVHGDILERDRYAIGVIGTRKPSHYAVDCTKKLYYKLAYSGVTVVSGLARAAGRVGAGAASWRRGEPPRLCLGCDGVPQDLPSALDRAWADRRCVCVPHRSASGGSAGGRAGRRYGDQRVRAAAARARTVHGMFGALAPSRSIGGHRLHLLVSG